MTRCPKCNSTTIVGPTYVRFSHKTTGEALRYVCAKCGYVTDTKTRDAR